MNVVVESFIICYNTKSNRVRIHLYVVIICKNFAKECYFSCTKIKIVF